MEDDSPGLIAEIGAVFALEPNFKREDLPRLEIKGGLRTSNMFVSDRLCDQDIGDCFLHDVIGGQGDYCNQETHYMSGISYSKAECRDAVLCPRYQYMIGVDADKGRPICKDFPADCEEKEVSLCDKPYTLPKVDTAKKVSLKAGYDVQVVYQCQIDEWKLISMSGTCEEPEPPPEKECEPSEGVADLGCPEGFVGDKKREYTVACISPTESKKSYGAVVEDTCTCVSQIAYRDKACSQGYIGKITQERSFLCPDAVWSSWKTIADLCHRSFYEN